MLQGKQHTRGSNKKFPIVLATQNKVITVYIVKKWRDKQATEALIEVAKYTYHYHVLCFKYISSFISQKYKEKIKIIVGSDVYEDVKYLNNVICKDNCNIFD